MSAAAVRRRGFAASVGVGASDRTFAVSLTRAGGVFP
jgi:hypothetical protein